MRMKKILVIALIAVLAVSIVTGVSCKAATTTTAAGETTAAASQEPVAEEQMKFAMIFHETSSPFAAFFKKGGEDAAKLCGVKFDFMGTENIDIPKQVSIFENAVQGGYDSISTTIFDTKAFERGIQTANDKGVAVFSFNIDGEPGARSTLGYSGADEFGLGVRLGNYFFGEVMKGKGDYIIFPGSASLNVLVWRMDGYKEAQKAFPDIKLINIIETGWDTTKAYAVVENAYTAHPETTAMMGTDFFSEQIGAFISRNSLKDKVKAALFDPTPGIIKYLKSGDAQVVLGQNPYLQGFYAVMQGYLYLVQKQPALEVDTGYELITPESMQYYLDYYKLN